MGNGLKIMIFCLLLLIRAADAPNYSGFLDKTYTLLEKYTNKLVNLLQLQHTIILNLKKQLLRSDLLRLIDKDKAGVFGRQLMQFDNIRVMRVIFAIVVSAIIMGNVIAFVDGLEH